MGVRATQHLPREGARHVNVGAELGLPGNLVDGVDLRCVASEYPKGPFHHDGAALPPMSQSLWTQSDQAFPSVAPCPREPSRILDDSRRWFGPGILVAPSHRLTGHQRGHQAAAEALEREWERMVTFYGFPREHLQRLRTANPVESLLPLRFRSDAAKRPNRVDRATAVIRKMLMVAEKRFRRLRAGR